MPAGLLATVSVMKWRLGLMDCAKRYSGAFQMVSF